MNEHATILRTLMNEHGQLEVPSKGMSMYPFIKEGDCCVFETMDLSLIKRGDVVLFQSRDGNLTGHRFIKSHKSSTKQWFIFKGDTNLYPDAPVRESEIIGVLTSISRNNRTIRMNSPLIKAYSLSFSYLRFFSVLAHIYVNKILKKRDLADEHSRSY
ncbi:signal peptidase I [Alkalihalobacillus sp. CinArs1]|uniref:signal peptidase I n=1 Tax=Alkalihalobacillus sp. CinArs1 TaxID=2995314 RepID=UPI0022DD9C5F|nr:signal peptidase I [Alkalihalobacillus sp. CinArs1]